MPDFSTAPVKQQIREEHCLPIVDAWQVEMDGNKPLTEAIMVPLWWLYGRDANELRVDIQVDGATDGDQIRVEVWQQPQNVAGGGVMVFGGTVTLANSPTKWFTLGAGRGPLGDAWGLRANLVLAGPGAASRRLRGRLVGMVTQGGTLGGVIRGEGVVP